MRFPIAPNNEIVRVIILNDYSQQNINGLLTLYIQWSKILVYIQ
jgi:hypothetical protein